MKLLKSGNIVYFANPNRLEVAYGFSGPYVVWNLYPVAIYDYVNPDYSDKQGWLQEFNNGKQVLYDMDQLLQYINDESFTDVAKDYGYESVEVSGVYLRVYDKNEDTMSAPRLIDTDDAVDNAMNGLDTGYYLEGKEIDL